jgi:PEP-CTERM motif
MKHSTFGIIAVLAFLALSALALGPSVRADSTDTFVVTGVFGNSTFDVDPFSVPASSLAADTYYNVDGGGTVPGLIGGAATDFLVSIIGPGQATPANTVYLKCDTGIVCAAEIVVSLAGTYTLSPSSGPPSDQLMNFIPGVYDGGDLVITGPVPTPEPATLPLIAAGIAALAFFRRRFPKQMRPLPSGI